MTLSELHSKLVVLPRIEAHRLRCLAVGYESSTCGVCINHLICRADEAERRYKVKHPS